MEQYKFSKGETRWDECAPFESISKSPSEKESSCLVTESGCLINRGSAVFLTETTECFIKEGRKSLNFSK